MSDFVDGARAETSCKDGLACRSARFLSKLVAMGSVRRVVRSHIVILVCGGIPLVACRDDAGGATTTSDGSTTLGKSDATGAESESGEDGAPGTGSSTSTSTSTSGSAGTSSGGGSTTTGTSTTMDVTSTGESSGGEESSDGGPRPIVTPEPGTDLVRIDYETRHQAFEGWGTSLCWWANHVGGWQPANRDAVIEAVVDPIEGLGYNIFRYNIGGGENPAHDHMREHREIPGFQTADGTWTWDADANQRAVLLGIAERGSDLIFEAFSNSPPYWMTNSGCASGSANGTNNLGDGYYDDFAHYLTEVVRHYRDTHGIVFRTLEPLNEPFSSWWTSNGTQEGCHFDTLDQERILQEVAAQLVEKGLDGTVVSGTDENSMDEAVRNLGAFSQTTIDVLGQINVHSYAGSSRRQLRMLADRLGKRLWQSESGPLGQSIDDDMQAAIFMAARIIEDLRDLKPEAWIDWQTGDPSRSWASIVLDDRDQSFTPIKRFYMHAGFSRYIRPGAVFLGVDHPDMVAALAPNERSVTIVVLNREAAGSHEFTFDLTALPSVGAQMEAFRTSRAEDLEPLPPLAIEDYRVVVSAPATSITTFVVPFR